MDRKLGLILVLSTLGLFSPTFANEACKGSSVSSEDDLTITNGKRRVRGKSIDNFEQVQVKWEPNIEQNKATFDEYDLTRLKLHILEQGGKWKEFVPKKQVKYHGHYKWAVPRIPCLKYDYKILVPSKNEANTFLCTVAKSKLPETKEIIRSAKFKPEPPTDIVRSIESNHASFSWNRSQCAEEYELYVTDSDHVDPRHEVVKQLDDVNGANAEFDKLKSCTSYEVEVYAKVEGGEDGDEFLKESFQTKPAIDSASHLDLNDTKSTASDATLRFFTYMDEVNCLKNFTIETCQKNDCSRQKNIVIAENHEELKYDSNGLEHCTNYFLKVQPSYPEVDIEPKNVNITTKFDETKKIVPSIEPRAHDVKLTMKNIDCVKSYVISYGIVGEDDMEEMEGIMDMEVITIDGLNASRSYQVNMTGTLKTGESVTVFELYTFETTEKQATTQVKKETSASFTQVSFKGRNAEFNDVSTSADMHGETTQSHETSGDDQNGSSSPVAPGEGTSQGNLADADSTSEPDVDLTEKPEVDHTSDVVDGNSDENENGPTTATGGGEVIIIVVVVIILLVGAVIGFVVIRKRQGGGDPETEIENEKYKQVPQNDIQADNSPE